MTIHFFTGGFFCHAGKPFENKSFAQFYEVKYNKSTLQLIKIIHFTLNRGLVIDSLYLTKLSNAQFLGKPLASAIKFPMMRTFKGPLKYLLMPLLGKN